MNELGEAVKCLFIGLAIIFLVAIGSALYFGIKLASQ